jgi:hypothetical protein
MQSKTTEMPTLHTLNWLKIKRLTVSSADKDVKQLELSYIADGNEKQYSHFEKQFLRFQDGD